MDASAYETSVNSYQFTLRSIPEDSVYTRRRENLKSHRDVILFCDFKFRTAIISQSEMLKLNIVSENQLELIA
jgi:hypothetical protein